MIYRIIREKNDIDRNVLWKMKWKRGYVYHVYNLPCLSCSFTFNFLARVHKSLGLSRKTHSWRGNCGNSIPSSSIIKVNNIQFSTTKSKQTDSLLSSIGFSIWRKGKSPYSSFQNNILSQYWLFVANLDKIVPSTENIAVK